MMRICVGKRVNGGGNFHRLSFYDDLSCTISLKLAQFIGMPKDAVK